MAGVAGLRRSVVAWPASPSVAGGVRRGRGSLPAWRQGGEALRRAVQISGRGDGVHAFSAEGQKDGMAGRTKPQARLRSSGPWGPLQGSRASVQGSCACPPETPSGRRWRAQSKAKPPKTTPAHATAEKLLSSKIPPREARSEEDFENFSACARRPVPAVVSPPRGLADVDPAGGLAARALEP